MTRTHRSMCSSLATSWYVKLWQGWKYLLIGTQVTQDQQYFQRVKWQYMILDEAQNIKNSSSARWKTLLGFQCRKDRKSTRLNSSHSGESRMPSSA